jgi:hypothetical protein
VSFDNHPTTDAVANGISALENRKPFYSFDKAAAFRDRPDASKHNDLPTVPWYR